MINKNIFIIIKKTNNINTIFSFKTNLSPKETTPISPKKTFILQEKNNLWIEKFNSSFYNNHLNNINHNYVLETRIDFIFFSHYVKEFFCNAICKKKQKIYALNTFSRIINVIIKNVFLIESFNIISGISGNALFLKKNKLQNIFLNRYLNDLVLGKNFGLILLNNAFLENVLLLDKTSLKYLTQMQFCIQNAQIKTKTGIQELSMQPFYEEHLFFFKENLSRQPIKNNFEVFLRKKNLTSMLFNRNIIEAPISLLHSLKRKKALPKYFIWKKNNLTLSSFIYNQNLQKNKVFSNHKLLKNTFHDNFANFINKIEEKIRILKNDSKTTTKLKQFKNLLLRKWEKRLTRQKGKHMFLSTIRELRKIRSFKWKNYFKTILLKRIKQKNENKKELNILLNKILNLTPTENKNNSSSFKNFYRNVSPWKKPLKIRLLFKNKKVTLKNEAKNYLNYNNVLNVLFNQKVNIFYINAVALTRFAFKTENNNKNPKVFLENVERELVNRYKYVANYIQDLVQISFITLFFKKPTFLAKFIAFQIEKLPRNRKETKLIKFIIKTVKIFAAQRKETLGIRLRFKGRVNRWRRTKAIIAERGTINLHSHQERIEYGSAKAVTRKGTLGISLWIRYSPYFQFEIENATKQYIKYSKYLHAKMIKNFLYCYGNTLKK